MEEAEAAREVTGPNLHGWEDQDLDPGLSDFATRSQDHSGVAGS